MWAGGGPWLRDVAARVVVVVVAVMMVHPLRALTTCPDMVLPLARLARLRLDSKVVCLPSRCPAPGLLGGDAFSGGIPTTRDFYTNAGQMRGGGGRRRRPGKIGLYFQKSNLPEGKNSFFNSDSSTMVPGKSVSRCGQLSYILLLFWLCSN